MVWLPAGARLEGSRRLQDMHWRFSVLPLFECAENAPENRFVRGKEESVASGCKTLAPQKPDSEASFSWLALKRIEVKRWGSRIVVL